MASLSIELIVKLNCKILSYIPPWVALWKDTDGIKTDCLLDKEDVGNDLGDMKYEYSFKEFVSIAPKVYGGILKQDT